VETLTEPLADTEALVAALDGAAVVVAMRERTRFDADRLARLGDLRLLVTTGMGNAAIDLEAAAAKGIVVSGTRGRARHTVELTWALILALLRSIPAEDARMRQGGWQQTIGTELDGATLGLVGLGRLGSAMVPIARAFGMDVVAWSQNLDADRAAEAGAEAVSKDELFRRADVVSVHYKLSPRSEGIVGAAEIAAMKPTAYFVNTSRGPLVDTAALLRALHDGAIAGAALDVYDREPLPADDPLRTAPRTVLSPHLGYVTRENYRVFFEDVIADIEAWLDGRIERRLTPEP
jgi:phosphoglycerate dehydrogenase-like enzyme